MSKGKKTKKHVGKGKSVHNSEYVTHLITEPDAPFHYKEAYKSLRTNLEFLSASQNIQVIVVTSSIPGEGKSNTSINLALTMAENGSDVLVVDCDLRKPRLYKSLGVAEGRRIGLTSVLSKKLSFEECIFRSDGYTLDVLCAGAIPPNPSELLSSTGMGDFIKEARNRYDYVILDTPPVSIVTDASTLSQYADGAILVVRQDYVTKDAAADAVEALESVGVNILGAILNDYSGKVAGKTDGYYSKYDYKYGYKRGYGYGYGDVYGDKPDMTDVDYANDADATDATLEE